MIFPSLLLLLAAQFSVISAQYQETYGPNNNVAPLTGTWASGAGNVVTGVGFANPVNRSFNYPQTTGMSYSFTDNGFFEEARYRFLSNGSEPTCIVGVIGWSHGTYESFDNGTLVLHPWEDSFQQIQDPCAAVSNFIESYNGTEYYNAWQVYRDTAKGLTARLYAFDGSPLPPMVQLSATPNMLPTKLLANASSTITDDGTILRKRSGSPKQVSDGWRTSAFAAAGLAALGWFML